jgi:hypothetical protein
LPGSVGGQPARRGCSYAEVPAAAALRIIRPHNSGERKSAVPNYRQPSKLRPTIQSGLSAEKKALHLVFG